MKYALKLAFRNLKRNPVINFINLFGLSTSVAIVILLSSYCNSELSTDHFQKYGDRVFLITGSETQLFTPDILWEHLENEIPDIERVVRITESWEEPVFQTGKREPLASRFIFADEGFFDLFTYHTCQGNLKNVLRDPESIILTKKEALRLFGKSEVIGETVKLDNKYLFTVKAVILEPEYNTFLKFNAILPVSSMPMLRNYPDEFTNWNISNFQTFILTREGNDPHILEKNILHVFNSHMDKENRYSDTIHLLPLKDIYFSSIEVGWLNFIRTGNKQKVIILMMVAVLILMIALINYINISSSGYPERIRQAHIQKILGASGLQIIRNILMESFLLFVISVWLAILLVEFIRPHIHNYTGITFNSTLIYTPEFFLILMASAVLISILSGLSHAIPIYYSSMPDKLKPIKTRNKSAIRTFLVVGQFLIAIVLISFTFLVQKQIRFGEVNLGFKNENILAIKLTTQLFESRAVFRNQLKALSGIKDISFSQFCPGKDISFWIFPILNNGKTINASFNTFDADAEFFKMMGIELIKGRFYTDTLPTDKNKVIVDETFLTFNNIPDPIGATFGGEHNDVFEITGIMKDFHFKPVNETIAPLAIKNRDYASYCLVQIINNDFRSIRNSINNIRNISDDLSPDFPVEISFIDSAIEDMYQSEIRFRKTFFLFAGCAILISCLGILALSLYICQNRTKEIGIRKVNGATILNIFGLLNKDFLKWVLIAFVISCPVSWYVMRKWLENFAYKTNLSWWIFAVAGALALLIAFITVSFHSWLAARKNLVEILRYE